MTKVEFIRKDSFGIAGTYQNAEHHAQELIPLIQVLEKDVMSVGFVKWRQGHNVHEFVNHEGTKYTLRGFKKDGEYFGIRLALRISRSVEIRLMEITSIKECAKLIAFMKKLAEPIAGDASGVMC